MKTSLLRYDSFIESIRESQEIYELSRVRAAYGRLLVRRANQGLIAGSLSLQVKSSFQAVTEKWETELEEEVGGNQKGSLSILAF